MVARYILLIFLTLNSRHFKCVSHPLVVFITAITTDNDIGYVIMTCIHSTILSHL